MILANTISAIDCVVERLGWKRLLTYAWKQTEGLFDVIKGSRNR
jgi:hypothetical protein